MRLSVLKMPFSVCLLAGESGVHFQSEFIFFAKTDRETSLVLPSAEAETLPPETVRERSDGWRGFRIDGVLDFSLVGVLANIASVLAKAGVPIFAVSTYQTDYIFTKEEHFAKALSALLQAGFAVETAPLGK